MNNIDSSKIAHGLAVFVRFAVFGLSIVSFVLYFAHFISHCEEPVSVYYFSEPLPVSEDIGCEIDLSSELVSALVSRVQTGPYPTGYPYNERGFDNLNLVLFREYYVDSSSGHQLIQVVCFFDGYISSWNWPSDLTTGSNICNFKSLSNWPLIVTYDITNDTITYTSSGSTSGYNLGFIPAGSVNSWVTNPHGSAHTVILTNTNIVNYPIYLRDGELSFNGEVRFQEASPTGGDDPEHSKGGVIADYIDSIDNIDGSGLPQIDITINNPDLQDILEGLNTITQSIQGGFISLLDLVDKIKVLLEQWFSTPSPTDVMDIIDSSSSGSFISDCIGYINTIYGLITGVMPPESLVFSIPLNWWVFHDTITLDFSWYAQVRNTVLPIILTFLYCGLGLYFIKQIPSLINGQSGTLNNFTNVEQPSVVNGVYQFGVGRGR